jgi:putative transposase
MHDRFHWARVLAFVTGLVNQELLLRNEYLAAENRILRAHLPPRLGLSDAERSTLAEIAKRLGRKALKDIARVAKPDTLLAWYRRLVAQKFDGSRCRTYPGRPRIWPEVEALVVQLARENRSWGYDRIVGALTNLGYQVSDQTVGNILRRHNLAPAPDRSRTTTWKEFIKSHMDVLGRSRLFNGRGPDLARVGDVLRAVLHRSRQSTGIVGRHRAPSGLVLDAAGGANAHAERWVRSIKEECLSKLILFGEKSLQRVVSNFLEHYHQERNHQGKDNLLLFPASVPDPGSRGAICCRERLGGLLKYYSRAA